MGITAGLVAGLSLPFANFHLVVGFAVAGETAKPGASAPPAAGLVDKLDHSKSELQAKEARAAELNDDVAKLTAEREKLNTRLLETAALIQKSEAQMSAIEGRLGELEAQEKLVRGSLSQQHGQIAKLLSALQRMGRNPPPVMITRREDALGMVRSAMLLASAFPEMREQALALAEKLNELARVMDDIRMEGDRLKTETASLNEMRTRLAGLMETKKQSLGERQAELAQVRAATQEIQKNVSDLNELIVKLDETVRRNTALGAYERETATAAASGTPAASGASAAGGIVAAVAPSAGPDAAPAAKPVETALNIPPPAKPADPQFTEMAPAGSSLVPGNAGRIKPSMAFEVAKARLPLPAQGRKVLDFGEKTQFGGTSKGIVLETRPSALVTSPCDGWIVYAGEFRSYGQLLIINAGGGYHVLVAGLSQIDVQPGQFVLAAEAIGTMSGQPKSAPGVSKSSAPVLYIEFRKDGQPIDPDPWWVAGQQKVQG